MEIDTTLEKTAPLSAINYLQYRSSTASVDSFAGSFYYTATNPSVVSIRPTSGAPGSSKYRYEVAVRMAGAEGYAYNNMNISNIWAKSSGAGYGPIEAGDNMTLSNSIITGGTTHHITFKSGTMNNVLIGRAPKGMPSGSTPIAVYESNATGNVSLISNTIFYKTQNAMIAHAGGSGNHRKVSLDNVYFFGDSINYKNQSVIGGDQVDTFLINRIYVSNVGSVAGPNTNYLQITNSAFVNLSRPAWIFNHPSNLSRKAIFDNVFYRTYSNSGNQTTGATGYAGFLYKPNLLTKVTIQNSTFHIKSTSTVAADNGGFVSANTVLNNIIVADQPSGRYTRAQNNYTDTIAASDYNVYIKVSGSGFSWLVNPALNGGNANVYSLSTWQSVSGFDSHSIYIDLSNNALGLRAIFVDPDAGNYTLLPGGQYTAQIMALNAGMKTPITGWVTEPTEEQAAEAVINEAVPLVLNWNRSASGTPSSFPGNYVKWSPNSFTANRIPYTTAYNALADTSLLRYTPSTGIDVKGTSTSSGKTFEAKNSANTSIFYIGNNGNVGVGTSSPGYRLDLGTSINTLLLTLYNSGLERFGFGVTGGKLNVSLGAGSALSLGNWGSGSYSEKGILDPASGKIIFSSNQATGALDGTAPFVKFENGTSVFSITNGSGGTEPYIGMSNGAVKGMLSGLNTTDGFYNGSFSAHPYTIRVSNSAKARYHTSGGFAFGGTYYSTDPGANNISVEGKIAVGATSTTTSAKLEVVSTTQGFLPPRMTSAQRDAISSPATGLTLYCTDCTATDASTEVMQTYNGTTWKNNW